MNEWGFYPLGENQWHHFALGQFDWWVQYTRGIWSHIAELRELISADTKAAENETVLEAAEADSEQSPEPIGPPDSAPSRHIAENKTQPAGIELVPRCPDRPILLKSSAPISFQAGSTVDLYFTVPLWWSARTSDGEELYQAPIEQLSQSWFGDSARGTLCYSLFADPDHEQTRVCEEPSRAACTLRVRNNSPSIYKSDRFLIPAEQLVVFGWREFSCAVATSSVLTVVSNTADVHVTVLNGEPKGRISGADSTEPIYTNDSAGIAFGRRGTRSDRRKTQSPWKALSEPRVAPSEVWWKWGVNLLQRISNY